MTPLDRSPPRLAGVALAWSVRLRVTLAAAGVVLGLLAVASLALVWLVERELVREAETVMADSLAELNEEVGPVGREGNAFFEYETEDGVVFLGIVSEGDALVAPIIDSQTREEIGEVVLDPDTGEIVEAYVDQRPVSVAELPDEVAARFAEVTEIIRSVPSFGSGGVVVTSAPLEGVRSSLVVLRRALLVVIPALGLALGVAVWWLAGSALRPVGEISERARRIGADTLAERVPVPRARDEVGELARVVNGMLDRIERGVARERQFVADASHELRTPLATIRAAAELADHRSCQHTTQSAANEDDAADPPSAWRGVAADVLAEVDRMDTLVDDLLVMARLDDGHLDTHGAEIDLDDLAGRAVAASSDHRVELATQEATRRPEREAAATMPVARTRGHEGLLLRLMSNLLANARRYAEEHIAVSVVASGGWVELRVDDDGPGVPEHERERVFQRFVRLDASRTEDGFGLGLAIVRAIAQQHGGSVRVEDSPLGGARFVVALPRREDPLGTTNPARQ